MFAAHITAVASQITLSDYSALGYYRLTSTGLAQESIAGVSYTTIETYCTGNPADFEVRATLLSGDITNGTFGSWLSLATTREWSNPATDPFNLKFGEMLLEIRRGGTVLASAIIDITEPL